MPKPFLAATNEASFAGVSEILTPQLLAFFLALMMKHSGVTLGHVKLLRSVWGLEYGGKLEYLRTYVNILRKKIEKVSAKPEYIVNEPWIGYRFRNPEYRNPRSDAEGLKLKH
jgi:two-component system KDP operon response regulator KdpE